MHTANHIITDSSIIVLFDGVCNYCNALVNWCIKNDPDARIKFSTLQSEKALQLMNQYSIDPAINSMVLIENGQYYLYSTAALRITRHLRFPISILYIFVLFPAFLRNPLYKWIAKNRYQWFGKKATCMVPDAAIQKRFL